jgi:putative tricarboxylic transport membrane protein
MRSVHATRFIAILLGGSGIVFVYLGFQFDYWGFTGPGPGFFPIWIGVLLAGSCLVLFIQTLAGADGTELFFPEPGAAFRVFSLMISLVVVWALLDFMGFRLAVLLFALIVPHILDRQSATTTVIVALVASFGIAYGFESWLLVQLPEPAFGWLRDIGL